MKPILFNTEMTRRVLADRKTVTRRVIKPRSPKACGFCVARNKQDGSVTGVYDCYDHGGMFDAPQKPPYSPGDILYVRETWARIDYDVDPIWFEEPALLRRGQIIYRAEYPDFPECRWRPSIHMPRDAARIFLRATDVRVERLQDITDDQARWEGVGDPYDYQEPEWYDLRGLTQNYYVDSFAGMWESIIMQKDRALYGWAANPYVWVIEFERISREGAVNG